MSYTSIRSYLMKLTQDAKYTEQIQDGHWMWVYDNLNLHQVVRHEREGIYLIIIHKHPSNMTPCIICRQTFFYAKRDSKTSSKD